MFQNEWSNFINVVTPHVFEILLGCVSLSPGRWSKKDSIKGLKNSHDGNGTLLFFVQVSEQFNNLQNYEMYDDHKHQ
jgi:hypothetical protein